MGKYIAVTHVFATLLVLASSVRLERLADGKYRVEAIFAATRESPRQARTTLFTSRGRAEATYWHYLLEKTPVSLARDRVTRASSSSAR